MAFRLSFAELKGLLQKTFANWSNDNVPRLAAAFSFYAMLSLSPVLVLAVVAAGMVLGNDASARGFVERLAVEYLGNAGKDLTTTLLDQAKSPALSSIAGLVSVLVTMYGASNLFLQLEDTANTIWGIKSTGPFFRSFIVQRIVAFTMVAVFGLLVIAWLALDSWLGWLGRVGRAGSWWQYVSLLVSVVFLTFVFGATYKTLPKGKVAWSDVWIGAVIAAIGFGLSKLLLSVYFKYAGVAAAYGSAGALVVVLLWIYYTSQIFFFGFEVVNTYAYEHGSHRREEPVVQYS